MTFVDRYRLAGLPGNPFSAPQRTTEVAAHFVDRGLGPAPTAGQGLLVQVIGDSGYGKSTQLAHWRATVPGPYHYIPRAPYRRRWATPPIEPLVYGDEIDRMPSLRRAAWFRALASVGATVIVGTHVDLARTARRHGLEVISHWLRPLTLAQLRALLEGTLNAAGTPRVQFSDEDTKVIASRSGGVPREVCVSAHELLAERVADFATQST